MFHPSKLLRGCNLPGAPVASALIKLCISENTERIMLERY